MSSVLVVVIVGVVIAAIAGATLHERKPATPAEHVRRGPEPPPPPAPVPPGPATGGWEPPERPVEGVPDERTALGRVRAGALLAATVVVLGACIAGAIGGSLYLGVHLLREAVR